MASPHVSFQAVRRPGRPPARGGPTLDGKQATGKGWPQKRSLKPVRRPGRPPARGGPTIDGKQASRKGWPHRRSRKPVRRPGRPAARGGPTIYDSFPGGPSRPSRVGPPLAGGLGGFLDDDSFPGGPSRPSRVGPPLAGGLGGAASVACFALARASGNVYRASPGRWPGAG